MDAVKTLTKNLIFKVAQTEIGKLAMWKLARAAGVERMALRSEDGLFMTSTSDNMIALKILTTGGFDKGKVRASCAMAASYLGSGDLVYLDVGANIGTNAVYALQNPAFSRAICFEPDPRNFYNLAQTMALNGLTERCDLREAAVGDEDGLVELVLSEANFGDHHVRPSPDGGVPVVRLDTALAGTENIGLVCVDVQGYEAHVLDGAPDLLARDIPWLCEIAPGQIRRANGYDRFFRLAEASFSWFCDLKTPGNLRPITELRSHADAIGEASHCDVFLTKRCR
jgi:FkbM family methyltransferase